MTSKLDNMKRKIFFIVMICLATARIQAQSLCLQTQCLATKARVGDTTQLAAKLTTAAGYSSITYNLQPGAPSSPTVTYTQAAYTTSLQAQQNIQVTNLAAGTYIWQVVGKDQAGGSVIGYDSLIVSPAIPACPAPRTVSTVTISVGGISVTIPASAAKFTFTDGTSQ